jgi:hypothetical protein
MFLSLKRLQSIGLLCLLALLAVILIRACSNQTQVPSTVPLLGQGIYDDCAPGIPSCLDDLKTIADGGFKLVLNYASLRGTPAQLLAYADQAQAVGLKLIWGMHNRIIWESDNPASGYPALAEACSCSDSVTFARFVVNLVKNDPATWGYYIGDEVTSKDHAQLKAYADVIRRSDPLHPRLIIGSTPNVSASNWVDPNLSTFSDSAEVLGQDYYPIDYSALPPYTKTGVVAREVQTAVTAYGRDPAMVLQSFSLAQSGDRATCSPYPDCAPFPTEQQMQQMLTLTLQNSHPRLILWYSFFDILRSDNPVRHWMDLVMAAHAVT